MNKRLLIVCTTLIVFGLLISPCSIAPGTKSVQSMTMFQVPKFTAHYRAPRDEDVERILRDERILRPGADIATIQSAVHEFKQEWFERNPTTPAPHKLRQLLNKERGEARALAQAQDSQIQSLVVPVEFPGEDTFEWCGSTVTTSGPLHNQIPPPGPRDNNTIWYEDASTALYDELYFGVGPDAGVIVTHPNLGEVDLRGKTMANYYLEQSEGAFVPTGAVYPKWLQATRSEGW